MRHPDDELADLDEIEAIMPPTFYADLPLPNRVRKLVASWQRAISVVNESERPEKEIWGNRAGQRR